MDGTLTADGSLGRSSRLKAIWRGDSGVLLGLLLVAILFGALIGPQFFRPANLELMAIQTVIVCVAALGMTMVIVSSGIDLSVGSIVALATVVTAVMLRHGYSPAVSALGALGAAAVCGLVNGLLITRLKVVPFIVTLGTMLLVRGAAKGIAEERRVEAPLTWLNELLRTARGGSGFGVPIGIWITVAAGVDRGRRARLHALWPAPLRDRLERAHGAAVRRQGRAPQAAGLHAVGDLRGPRRHLPVLTACRSATRRSPSASSST